MLKVVTVLGIAALALVLVTLSAGALIVPERETSASLRAVRVSLDTVDQVVDTLTPQAACREMRQRARELAPLARECEHDSQCFHYPCSCSALADGPASGELMDLHRSLSSSCGDPITYAYCGDTVPVCVEGRCSVEQDGFDEPGLWVGTSPSFGEITARVPESPSLDIAMPAPDPARLRR